MSFIVTKAAMRPASDKKQCFYCQQAIGQEHKADCVTIVNKVRVRMTVEYDIDVPSDWTFAAVERYRNDGSWCADSAIEELKEASELAGCLCGIAHFECLGKVCGPFLKEY